MDFERMWNTLYLKLIVMKTECVRKEKIPFETIVRMMETIENRENEISERIERYLGKDGDYE